MILIHVFQSLDSYNYRLQARFGGKADWGAAISRQRTLLLTEPDSNQVGMEK